MWLSLARWGDGYGGAWKYNASFSAHYRTRFHRNQASGLPLTGRGCGGAWLYNASGVEYY